MKSTIIIGAGVAGKELLTELKKHLKSVYDVIGFLDDNEKIIGKKINGLKILGKTNILSEIVKKYSISEVFIAIPSAQGKLVRDVIKRCEKEKIIFKIVPRILEVIEGNVNLSKVREIQIEDLLGRSIIKSELKVFKKEFTNRTILVSGAAGSIGSEICRQIMSFKPKKLIALDFWESGLFDLDQELLDKYDNDQYKCVVANIQNAQKINKVFLENKPDIVFHAAAYKHVPLMQEFPEEAIRNNVIGSENMLKASILSGVEKFVNISTDKAVEPSNIMGATKLISEKLVTYYNSKEKTKFCSVRFGNVLGSQGSVVPTFKKQIAKGGPVTVTDKKMTRYFMTIPEAVQLVLSASMLVKDGGEVFMLDMGEPVKIDELARLMIRLSGLTPDVDINIKYTGVRPGEKMEEKLTNNDENKTATKNKRIFIIQKDVEKLNVINIVNELSVFSDKNDSIGIRRILKQVAHGLL